MEDNDTGDMILINRLFEFFSANDCLWNEGEVVKLEDITYAIHNGQAEESEPFGDYWKHFCMKKKSTKWHIGRILYFIRHPDEIRDIEIDNLCIDNYIFPVPKVMDGNHRLMAAIWLYKQGKLSKVHCRYGGRMDLLDYLTGKTEVCPDE